MFIFIVSPGHTGTKWIVHALRKAYPEFYVHHECLQTRADPGRTTDLGAHWLNTNFEQSSLSDVGNVPALLEEAEQKKDKTHVYVGWDTSILIPMFLNKFKDDVKVVFMDRDVSDYLRSSMKDIHLYGFIYDRECNKPIPPYCQTITGASLRPEVWQELTREGKILWWYYEVLAYVSLLKEVTPDIFHLEYEDIRDKNREKLKKFIEFCNFRWSEVFFKATEDKIQILDFYIDPKSDFKLENSEGI